MADKEKKKKESILDLSKYIDKTIRVKFQGGREASGILKGFDPLLNLVLDGTIEYMRGELDVVVPGMPPGPVSTPHLWGHIATGGCDLGCRSLPITRKVTSLP
ncbi:Lsm7 [Phodopus roborovskii]|uniref:Lsm7 protein n=1 Tax=Phodopus roborovskii TaxID=109678 RepID=A0AAU9YY06_PHORO|nr:Lsm7 [Phodopus roborovskii]